MLGSFSEGERTVKGCSDVLHAIDTHCIAFEHGAAKSSFINKQIDDKIMTA